MQWNFSFSRVTILIIAIVAFALWGGFSPPKVPLDSFVSPRRVFDAWITATILYMTGAVCISVVDHFVGVMDRSNIRILYIITGIAVMIGAFYWIRSLKSTEPSKETTSSVTAHARIA